MTHVRSTPTDTDPGLQPRRPLRCRRCGHASEAGTAACPECGSSLRPRPLGVICIWFMVAGVAQILRALALLSRASPYYVPLLLFLDVLLVTGIIFVCVGLLRGRYSAWRMAHWVLGFGLLYPSVAMLVIPDEVVQGVLLAVAVIRLFLWLPVVLYLHTKGVKAYCSVVARGDIHLGLVVVAYICAGFLPAAVQSIPAALGALAVLLFTRPSLGLRLLGVLVLTLWLVAVTGSWAGHLLLAAGWVGLMLLLSAAYALIVRAKGAKLREARPLRLFGVLALTFVACRVLVTFVAGVHCWEASAFLGVPFRAGPLRPVAASTSLPYRLHAPRRGDVVAYYKPTGTSIPTPIVRALLRGQFSRDVLMGRIAAVAGDTLSRDADGTVLVNGAPVAPHQGRRASSGFPLYDPSELYVVPEESFLMWSDSWRGTKYGKWIRRYIVGRRDILGKVVVIAGGSQTPILSVPRHSAQEP